MKLHGDIESLVRAAAALVCGDPAVALTLVANAARQGRRQVTLPKAWATLPYRVTVFLAGRGSISGERIPYCERNAHVREFKCAPDCDRHAPF